LVNRRLNTDPIISIRRIHYDPRWNKRDALLPGSVSATRKIHDPIP
jgi:hypothetical protein